MSRKHRTAIRQRVGHRMALRYLHSGRFARDVINGAMTCMGDLQVMNFVQDEFTSYRAWSDRLLADFAKAVRL